MAVKGLGWVGERGCPLPNGVCTERTCMGTVLVTPLDPHPPTPPLQAWLPLPTARGRTCAMAGKCGGRACAPSAAAAARRRGEACSTPHCHCCHNCCCRHCCCCCCLWPQHQEAGVLSACLHGHTGACTHLPADVIWTRSPTTHFWPASCACAGRRQHGGSVNAGRHTQAGRRMHHAHPNCLRAWAWACRSAHHVPGYPLLVHMVPGHPNHVADCHNHSPLHAVRDHLHRLLKYCIYCFLSM